MMRLARAGRFFGLCAVFAAAPAYAELPQPVLDRDYKSCIGDGGDSARNAYCACVREGMRGWSLETYAGVALAMLRTAHDPAAAPPAPLAALARQCIAKTVH